MTEPVVRPRRSWLVPLWAYGLFVLVHLVEYLWMGIATWTTGATFGEIAGGQVRSHGTLVIRGAVGLILGIPFALLVVRLLWRRSTAWLGLHLDLPLLGKGLLLGLLVTVVPVLLLFLAGWARILGTPDRLTAQQLVATLAGYGSWDLFTGFLEEVVFRGMVVRELALRYGWRRGAVLGGLFFGLSHLPNVMGALTPLLAFLVIGGGLIVSLCLTLLYVLGRSLWLPIGFHVAGNLLLSAIVGTTMSGQDSPFGLWQVELRGPALVTGGQFGLEVSVLSLATMAVFGLILAARLRRVRVPAPAELTGHA